MLGLWTALLAKANHKDAYVSDGTLIKAGQFMTSQKSLANEFKLDRVTLRRKLELLENEHQIEQQTSSKNTIITIVNWDKYQLSEHQNEHQVNIKRTSSEHQVNTNKNDNNNNNEKNKAKAFTDEIVQFYNDRCQKVGMPKVLKLNDKRKKMFQKAIKEYPSLDDWKAIFTGAKLHQDYVNSLREEKNWKADIDYMLRPDKTTMLYEKGMEKINEN